MGLINEISPLLRPLLTSITGSLIIPPPMVYQLILTMVETDEIADMLIDLC